MTAAAIRYPEQASEKQIAEILDLLLQSPIPVSYQEALISSVHSIDCQQAEAILLELSRLLFQEVRYGKAKEAWVETWSRIADQIKSRMDAELLTIEREFDAIFRLRR